MIESPPKSFEVEFEIEATFTDQGVVGIGALLLGLHHLVQHLRKKKMCLSFNFRILIQNFTLVESWPMFSLMAMSAWVAPRKSSRSRNIEFFVTILGSLQAQPLHLEVSEQLNQCFQNILGSLPRLFPKSICLHPFGIFVRFVFIFLT